MRQGCGEVRENAQNSHRLGKNVNPCGIWAVSRTEEKKEMIEKEDGHVGQATPWPPVAS